jgi:L-threonylcarbamoyladenylate synthase
MRLLDPATQLDAIEQAAQRLADGGLLALPTETVYGLGARADDDAAVARIFEAKGRPSNHPLIVHVANAEAAWQFASAVPLVAQQLMDRFWPGPLTVIVPRAPGMAAASAGGQDTIGLRCPDHPVALKLLQAAARLGVIDEFKDQGSGLDEVWVLQGGLCEVGIESTIVDCTRAHPVILRPGRLTRDEIEAAAGEPLGLSTPESPDPEAPRASGTLVAHYAPRAKLRLMSDTQLSSALDLIEPELTAKALANKAATPPGIAVYSRSLWAHRPASPGVVLRAMPADAISAAHHLFSDLRELDALGVELIWVEKPPVDPVWDGVRDRLARAAAA